jgi:2-furoyl-CoA dehydrogenase large subunit
MLSLQELIKKRVFIGKPVKRLEDLKLLKGEGGFTDDIELGDQHYAAILRSPYAHARIKRIDASKARSLPGVIYVLTGEEVAVHTKPMFARAAPRSPTSHYILAVGKVRYMGEPVAAVVAKDRYTAYDALELIEVEYEPLPVITTIEDALKPDAPLIYEELGTNVILHDKFEFGDVDIAFSKADVIIKERFRIHRYASTPIENYVVNAFYDRTKDELVVYATDQQPGRTIRAIERTLGIPPNKVRLIVPRIGGGYGYKLAVWQYVSLISLLSMLTGKPVKWVQTRMESLYGPHRPDGYMDAELALKADGTVLGMRLKDFQADGNWPFVAGLYSLIKFANMVGCYKIKNYSFEYHCVATNKPPVVQDRGVGKPFMIFVLERLMNLAAKKLNMDPIQIRFKNFIPPEEMPYTTPSGEVYESGNYPATLRKALEAIKYEEWKRKQKELREKGRYIGIGISCGIEPGTSNLGYYYLSRPGLPTFMGAGEVATVEMDMSGRLKVRTSSCEIGTGHMTAMAQVIADIFNVTPEEVVVDLPFDSSQGYLGYSGTYSNAFQDVDIGAVIRAANALKSKILRIASYHLRVDPDQLEIEDRHVFARFDRSRRMSFEDIATIAYRRLLLLPPGEDPGLRVQAAYTNPFAKPPQKANFNIQLTHANSAHIAVVEVDPETGKVKLLRYIIVHDAGRVINPKIVEGMAIGSTASGIGGVLYEEFVFDENGINLCLTFGEYLKPTPTEIPDIEVHEMESPAPSTVLGTKAAGEGGAITSLAAVANAIDDALSPFNIKITQLPLTPEKLWRMIKEAREVGK